MGQTGSTGESPEASSFLKQYNYVRTETTDNIGEFNLYEDKYNEYADLVMVKEIKCDSKLEYETLQQNVKRRQHLKNEYLVNFIASYSSVESEWCSKYYRHFLAYEYSSLTFEKELHDRYKMSQGNSVGKYFSEAELWYILSNLINAMIELKNIGIFHQDIQPANISVNSEGEIKLLDLMCYGQRPSGYSRMLISNDYFAALSPQLLKGLTIRATNPRQNIEKSDMFSLGITMLCAATNLHFTHFYDFKKFEVKFAEIVSKLNNLVNKGYSKLYVGTLSNLVHRDEGKRPSPQQLLNFIRVNSDGGI